MPLLQGKPTVSWAALGKILLVDGDKWSFSPSALKCSSGLLVQEMNGNT